MSDRAHDRTPLARRRRAAARPAPPISSSTATTGTRSPGPRRPSGSRTWPTASWRAASARARRSRLFARTTLEWSLFDFALAPGRCGRDARLPEQLAAGRRLHPRPLGVGRRALRGRGAGAPRSRASAAALPRLRHVLTFDDLPALEAEGARFQARAPAALDEAVAAVDEDDLFTLQYTSGTTGPPKGCMIRHRNYYAMVVGDRPPAGVRARRRPDAAVPPARPQLRAADAPDRPVRRLHDRLPARSAADGGRAADGAPHRAAERAARVREDPHGGRRRDRRDDGRQAAPGRLVARGRSARSASWRRRAARGRRACSSSTGSPTGSSSRRSASGSAVGCGRRSPAARRSARRSPSSSTRSGSGSSRATGSASAPRPRRRTRRALAVRHGRPGAARASSSASRRTASC